MRLQYPNLYDYCVDKQATVRKFFDGENWCIGFNRGFTEADLETWNNLMRDLQPVPVEDGEADEVSWGLERAGHYTTQSLCRFITHGGMTSTVDKIIWECQIPSKIQVFLWQLHHGKLQVATVLKKRGWKGDHGCSLCGVAETIDHIFFFCPLANFIWCCVREGLTLQISTPHFEPCCEGL